MFELEVIEYLNSTIKLSTFCELEVIEYLNSTIKLSTFCELEVIEYLNSTCKLSTFCELEVIEYFNSTCKLSTFCELEVIFTDLHWLQMQKPLIRMAQIYFVVSNLIVIFHRNFPFQRGEYCETCIPYMVICNSVQ